MPPEIIERFQQFFEKFPFFLISPTKAEDITLTQKTLDISLNTQYVAFLKRFGPSYMGIGLFPLSDEKHFGKGTTVVNATLSFHEVHGKDLPQELHKAYVISDDGAGNPILINSEGHLYIYFHDSGTFELLFPSFEAACEKTLREYQL